MFDDTSIPAARASRTLSQPAALPAWASAKRSASEWRPHGQGSLRLAVRAVRRALTHAPGSRQAR